MQVDGKGHEGNTAVAYIRSMLEETWNTFNEE